jgi:hypothetical protein
MHVDSFCLNNLIQACIIRYNSKEYLALKILENQSRNYYFIGYCTSAPIFTNINQNLTVTELFNGGRTITNEVTQNSPNLITGSAVYNFLGGIRAYPLPLNNQEKIIELMRFRISTGGVAGASLLFTTFQETVNGKSFPYNFGNINVSSGANANGFNINGFFSLPLPQSAKISVYKTSTQYIVYFSNVGYTFVHTTMILLKASGITLNVTAVANYEGTLIYDSYTNANNAIKYLS